MKPDPFDCEEFIPPPWWQGPLVTLGFILALIATVSFLTSCACHYDGTNLDCALDGDEALKAVIILSEK